MSKDIFLLEKIDDFFQKILTAFGIWTLSYTDVQGTETFQALTSRKRSAVLRRK